MGGILTQRALRIDLALDATWVALEMHGARGHHSAVAATDRRHRVDSKFHTIPKDFAELKANAAAIHSP
jgi:hypothetical protein